MTLDSDRDRELNSVEEVANELFATRNTQKTTVSVIFAFNGTGKTRLSRLISESEDNNCLCFNAIFQDYFTWDNENCVLNIDKMSWVVEFINEQGLQKQIVENFQNFYSDVFIYPQFSSDSHEVTFRAKLLEPDAETGEDYTEPIKVSKAEETIFVWSVFYTILAGAFAELQELEDNRSTDIFNNLEYVVIDDPVSSIDDAAIIKISLAIYDLLKTFANNSKKTGIDVLITTHHALFFNEICNVIDRGDKNLKLKSYILSRTKEQKYLLTDNSRNVFGYHLFLRKKIEEAIKNNALEKNHYNMFRVLLEKTKLYFGYKNFDECMPEFRDRKEAIRLMNKLSHFSEFEYSELTDREKEIFVEAFQKYTAKFRPEE